MTTVYKTKFNDRRPKTGKTRRYRLTQRLNKAADGFRGLVK